MKRVFLAIVCFFFLQNIIFAQPNFPKLTGRVVDQANILTPSQKNQLSSLLKNHEEQTSNQIVIVTLKSLEGYDIADYGYQLGRFWQIGQKDKNNGVLLIISMAEKKIRIEVGYGLEGALPDKTAYEIINYKIKPNFRNQNFFQGILEGTRTIISAIKGEYTPSKSSTSKSSIKGTILLYFAIIYISAILTSFVKRYKNITLSKLFRSSMLGGFAATFAIAFLGSFIISIIAFLVTSILVFIFTKKVSFETITHPNSYSNSGFGGGFSSSGGSFGGGFSGGGGSFGGGGASGGW